MDTSYAYLQLYAALSLISYIVGLCYFPDDLRGQWLNEEEGEGHVKVTRSEFGGKGRCVENVEDFYVIENSRELCFMCLLIKRRHVNILQYKESFCIGRDSLFRLCTFLHSSDVFHTLIRERLVHEQACPLLPVSYHFIYTNNSGGECRNPLSHAKSCANPSQFRLHFRHCPDAAYTHEYDMDLECVGGWTDGGKAFSIFKLLAVNSFGLRRGQFGEMGSRFRCTMYRTQGTVVYMSMSSDSTCRGLISPRDGPSVLEFTQDMFEWTTPSDCVYPWWIVRDSWRDLSGRNLYRAEIGDDSYIRAYFRSDATSPADVVKSFRCQKILKPNSTSMFQHVSVAVVSHGCVIRYQCIKFFKRKDDIIELHEGKFVESPSQAHCLETEMLSSNKRLLFPESMDVTDCPLEGVYRIHTAADMCDSFLHIGCDVTSVIHVINSCSSLTGFKLECMKQWKEGGRQMLVARILNDPSGVSNCFYFERKGSSLIFAVEPSCNIGTTSFVREKFVLERRTGCRTSSWRQTYPYSTYSVRFGELGHPAEVTDLHSGLYRHIHRDSMDSSRDIQQDSNSVTNAGASFGSVNRVFILCGLLKLLTLS